MLQTYIYNYTLQNKNDVNISLKYSRTSKKLQIKVRLNYLLTSPFILLYPISSKKKRLNNEFSNTNLFNPEKLKLLESKLRNYIVN